MQVPIGISNRHIHLNEADLKVLFGEGYELEKAKDLTQPGQYASTSKVTIKTDKDEISGVRVLGPIRPYTQVEISLTDAYKLGLKPPVRDSGNLDGSEAITIVGPVGELVLEKGCIIATRHIHITPEQMKEFGFEGKREVKVKIDGIKGGILDHVQLKVNPISYFELHLDTDDANAHLLGLGAIGEIIDEQE